LEEKYSSVGRSRGNGLRVTHFENKCFENSKNTSFYLFKRN